MPVGTSNRKAWSGISPSLSYEVNAIVLVKRVLEPVVQLSLRSRSINFRAGSTHMVRMMVVPAVVPGEALALFDAGIQYSARTASQSRETPSNGCLLYTSRCV